MPTHDTFDVGISLAKGIIFRKIGLANGAISKLWAAHPCPKFSREPPPPVVIFEMIESTAPLQQPHKRGTIFLGHPIHPVLTLSSKQVNIVVDIFIRSLIFM